MAKVTGPILSLGASGTIAKTMTFSTWRGIAYARQRVIPNNPQTARQTEVRETFAKLRETWKLLSADGRAPWDAFASGRPFTGMNSFVGENLRLIDEEVGIDNLEGSPGAGGGLPANSMSIAQGSSSGEMDVTQTIPSPPTGWTLTNAVALALPGQTPDGLLVGPVTVQVETVDETSFTITGLTAATVYQVSVWLTWLKDTGDTAYSVALQDQATSGV